MKSSTIVIPVSQTKINLQLVRLLTEPKITPHSIMGLLAIIKFSDMFLGIYFLGKMEPCEC